MYKESACLTMNEASPLSSISGFCLFFERTAMLVWKNRENFPGEVTFDLNQKVEWEEMFQLWEKSFEGPEAERNTLH